MVSEDNKEVRKKSSSTTNRSHHDFSQFSRNLLNSLSGKHKEVTKIRKMRKIVVALILKFHIICWIRRRRLTPTLAFNLLLESTFIQVIFRTSFYCHSFTDRWIILNVSWLLKHTPEMLANGIRECLRVLRAPKRFFVSGFKPSQNCFYYYFLVYRQGNHKLKKKDIFQHTQRVSLKATRPMSRICFLLDFFYYYYCFYFIW